MGGKSIKAVGASDGAAEYASDALGDNTSKSGSLENPYTFTGWERDC